MAKFSGFEKTGLKPLNFIRIAEFELFGEPKWLNLTALSPPQANLRFLKNWQNLVPHCTHLFQKFRS